MSALTEQDREELLRCPSRDAGLLVDVDRIVQRHLDDLRTRIATHLHDLAVLHYVAGRDGAAGLSRQDVADLLVDLEGVIRAGGPR